MARAYAHFTPEDQAGIRASWGITRNTLVDRLTEVEGWEVTPYVPNRGGKVIGTSGVSVGNGVDFGQWNADAFKSAGIPHYLVDRIDRLGLFGVKGQEALELSSKVNAEYGNLPFSDGEVALLSNVITGVVENEVRGWLKPGQYDSWNADEQTAVMSLAHVYGVPTLKEHPNASAFIRNEDWGGLYAEMRDYGDKSVGNRHVKMAEYLRPSVIRGHRDMNRNSGLYHGKEIANVALDRPLNTEGLA